MAPIYLILIKFSFFANSEQLFVCPLDCRMLQLVAYKSKDQMLVQSYRSKHKINPFHTVPLFLYPLERSENIGIFNIFKGYRKRQTAKP